MEAYLMSIITLASIYAIMVMAFNLSVGFTGLLNLGHIGLMAIGAYTSTILLKTYEAPFVLAVLAGMALTAVIGGLLAIPSKKIKGDYYALVTLGFMFVMQAVLINWTDLTRGTLGIPGVPRPELFATSSGFFVLSVATALLVFAFLYQLVRSPFGRALEAVRDDEEVAAALGKPTFKLKVISMMLAGAIVGLSGAYLASYVQFIAPNSFWFTVLDVALVGTIVGGIASMRGSILGVIVIFAVMEPLRFIGLPSELVGPLRLIVLEVIVLLLVIYRPKGIMGRAQLEF